MITTSHALRFIRTFTNPEIQMTRSCISTLFRAVAAVLLVMAGFMPTRSIARAEGSTVPVATPGLSVPTTRVLAIGTFTEKAVPDVWRPMLPAEARATTRLYLDGEIDQWYVKQDNSGIVLVLNETDPAKAQAVLHKLPAVQAGIMKFEVIALGPLSPLRTLLAEPAK